MKTVSSTQKCIRRIYAKRLRTVHNTKVPSQTNCWGATLYAMGHKNRMEWITEGYMDAWLKQNTIEVELPKRGSILVMRATKGYEWFSRNGLVHTAVYMGKGWYWHKCADDKARFDTLQDVLYYYADITDMDYFHVRYVSQKLKQVV